MRSFYFCLVAFLSLHFVVSQNSKNDFNLDFQFFRGNVYKHTPDVAHLTTGHPDGFLLTFNKKTNGSKDWHQYFNYPEYGFSIHTMDYNNKYLGTNYAIGAHFNFFFLKRHLMLRISQGIGMTTNPYDKVTNNKNNAFGTKILDNNYFLLQYQKKNLIGPIGLQTGFMLSHFSNGRFKAPNSGLNTFTFNIGLNYNFDKEQEYQKIDSLPDKKSFRERVKYNVAFRTGISEGPVVDLGQRQFYHIGLYADKRIGRKSALQLGTDVFFSRYLRDYIKYAVVAKPNGQIVDPNVDYKRIGVFVGHELFINKLSVETQVGYYVYKPFDYEIDLYQRVGLKYYTYKNCFTGIGLKTHGGRAEAIELTLGIRL